MTNITWKHYVCRHATPIYKWDGNFDQAKLDADFMALYPNLSMPRWVEFRFSCGEVHMGVLKMYRYPKYKNYGTSMKPEDIDGHLWTPSVSLKFSTKGLPNLILNPDLDQCKIAIEGLIAAYIAKLTGTTAP